MTLLTASPYEQFTDILSLFEHPLVQAQRLKKANTSTLLTPADVIENDDSYNIHMDLPGFEKENIEISFHQGRLTIKGQRETIKQENENKFKSIERSSGSFCRNFSFPDIVDCEKMTATYENGVLDIRVPKQSIAQPLRIEVK
ncbi:MAG: Hsp20/alpha crystallin family protein [Gammaproteobacteria bacterium]|nr:Hsp20/alpha crystallin family protein [Gammaproteobacteria bacterium]